MQTYGNILSPVHDEIDNEEYFEKCHNSEYVDISHENTCYC